MIDYQIKKINAANPFSLRNTIETNVLKRSNEANVPTERRAEIISADERANVCKICYIDADGIGSIVNNVVVSLNESFKNSFPKPGSSVIVSILNGVPTIVREHIDDINTLYSDKKIATDNSPNGDLSVSYYILPCGGVD